MALFWDREAIASLRDFRESLSQYTSELKIQDASRQESKAGLDTWLEGFCSNKAYEAPALARVLPELKSPKFAESTTLDSPNEVATSGGCQLIAHDWIGERPLSRRRRVSDDLVKERPRSGNCRMRSDSAPTCLLQHQVQCLTGGCSSTSPPRSRSATSDGVGVRSGRLSGGHSNSPLDENLCDAGETWPNFLERSARHVQEAGIEDTPDALFEVFRSTEDLRMTYATFARLYDHATSRRGSESGTSCASSSFPPWASSSEVPNRHWRYPYEPIRLMLGGNWKAKNLWALLDNRCAKPEYAGAPWSLGRLAGQRAVIVGSGPCGLRTAIELRLLGAQVTVLERRESFSRINQLHLWSWVGEELKSLGARVLEPPPKDFGADPDKLHIGIADLQKLLLKVALLLGVEVLLGVDFARIEWSGNEGWRAVLGPAFSAAGAGGEGRAGNSDVAKSKSNTCEEHSGGPSPKAPGFICHVAVLIGASGFGCDIGEKAGIRSVHTDHMRNESAIGVIVNYARTYNNSEQRLRSFSLAKQFYLPLFQKAKEATGAELENIVYVKGHDSHYFVMTPTPSCLIETGVVVDRTRKPLLDRDNINTEALDSFVRRVASFQFKSDEPAVMEAIRSEGMTRSRSQRLSRSGSQKALEAAQRYNETADTSTADPVYADRGPRVFDFSKMHRAATGVTFLSPPSQPPHSPRADNRSSSSTIQDDDDLLVVLVGDALIEPFWPEGLGIIRGFFAVLDGCAAVQQWALGASKQETQTYYEEAYVQLKTISAATRARVLRKDERLYALAPHTRYRQLDAPVQDTDSISFCGPQTQPCL